MSLDLVGRHEHKFAVGPDLADIPSVMAAVDACATAHGLDDDRRYALQVCVEEVLANLILHGTATEQRAKDIKATFIAEGPRAWISISDACAPFDPTMPPKAADPHAIGARGLRLLQAFARALSYRRADHRNVLDIEI